ncbi:MAG: Crp/Fnr family transcriptional regulator [Imperialibacter sp.]|uniref:Crp/Fnr family transcriptional regulator n=1 Tax=Imperialibacter sp. TaxID=2038411 RepID=UPI0032EE3CBA
MVKHSSQDIARLEAVIAQQIQINVTDLAMIKEKFVQVDARKGQVLVEAGQKCTEMYFIRSGYLRVFSLANGVETTLWIGNSGSFMTAISSFIFETSNRWTIQAITECQLEVLGRKDHFELLQRCPKWMEFDIVLLSRSFAMLEERMFAHLHSTARERLDLLMQNNPRLFLDVPLQYIASLLGVTPETISRLRKNSP